MKKPEFPNPRFIREDFLLPYKKYRIKKVIEYGQTLYYPQKKVLWWWNDVFGFGRYNFGGHFRTLEEAKKALHEKVYGTKNIEYIYDLD